MLTIKNLLKHLRLLLIPTVALLSGCNWVLMNPSGDVALQQRNIILISTGLMMLIIVPVIALTLLFAWRYRKANTKADYRPDWDHSTQLELVIWAAPLLIIIALGAITWISTHTLDPYRPLSRIDANRPVPADVKPLVVEVVALDWKWLFIYPNEGVATVNQLVVPAGVPLHFSLTSSSVMNAFFIPQLGSMIYTMNGMTTQLNLIADQPGVFRGLSSHYSGDGFADMNFQVRAVPADQFAAWAGTTRNAGPSLTPATYAELNKQSIKVAPFTYREVDPGMFSKIVSQELPPGPGPDSTQANNSVSPKTAR